MNEEKARKKESFEGISVSDEEGSLGKGAHTSLARPAEFFLSSIELKSLPTLTDVCNARGCNLIDHSAETFYLAYLLNLGINLHHD